MKYSSLDNLAETLSFCILKKGKIENMFYIDFLNFIPKNVPTHTKLVSFDIVSLYTNIPHNLGL